jgi:hypothetical protein
VNKPRKPNWWSLPRRAVSGVLLAVITLLVAARIFGLPRVVNERLQRELQTHGLFVQAGQLYLDVLGRVTARRVYIAKTDRASITQLGGGIEGSVMVEKAQVRFNWLSWWRGEPFLRGATVSRADLVFQLDRHTALRIEDVSADVNLHAKDVEVRYLRGRWRNLRVDFSGTLDLSGMMPAVGSQPLDLAKLAAACRRIEKIADQWTAPRPLTLSGQFKIPLAAPLEGTARLQLNGTDQGWRGVKIARVSVSAAYAADACQLDGTLEFTRGRLTMTGEWTRSAKQAELNFYSDIDLSLLAEALPEKSVPVLQAFHFNQLPVNQGAMRVTWDNGGGFVIMAKSQWRDFTIGGQKFDSFESAISYDGKRLMVTGLRLNSPAGTVTAELFHDGENQVRGRVDSAIDPRAFRALLGSGAQPFFNSIDFTVPPRINATISGLTMAQLTISGHINAADFAYKGVPIVSVGSDFDFQNHELHLAKLHVKRAEGEGRGEIWNNFKTKQVRVKAVRATLNAQDIALVLGDKMAEYMAPYQFIDTPTFTINGHFDLNDAEQKFRTDMQARLVARRGAHYVFMRRKLLLTDLDLGIAIKGQKMTLATNRPLTLFDGKMAGTLNVMLLPNPTYDTQLNFKTNDFASVMQTFFHHEKVTGRISGDLNLSGAFNDLNTLRGTGSLTVNDGELYNIPFLGGLSELLNSIIPDLGYAKASEAETNFTVSDSVFQIGKLDIKSLFFVLIGHGTYNFNRDHIELDMRANLRGAPGLATWLLSKVFEYHGTGPLAKTKWETKNF